MGIESPSKTTIMITVHHHLHWPRNSRFLVFEGDVAGEDETVSG